MSQYYTIVTDVGTVKIAHAITTSTLVNITQIAVGDGNGSEYAPTGQESALRRETWRGPVAAVTPDANNPNWIKLEGSIPANIGGFTLREVGLFDDSGTLIAIGNYPSTYKPMAGDGTTLDLVLNTIINVQNADVVNTTIDPTVAIASKKYVDEKLSEIEAMSEGVVSVLSFEPNLDDWTQAFRDAISSGKDVYVPKGFEFTIGDVNVYSQTVYGGGTIKKKVGAESAFIANVESTISGLRFESTSPTGQPNTDIKLADGARDVRILDNTFKSNQYSAISGAVDSASGGTPYAVNVNGVIISNNVFNGYARPVYLHSVDNIIISDNIFRNTEFDAIRLRENSGYCTIADNSFFDIGTPGASDNQTRDAVDTYWSGDTLTIIGNIIKRTSFAGFDVKGVKPGNKTQKVIIANNQIQDTRYNGIHIAGDIDDNLLYVDSVIIHDNIISGCNTDGGIDGNGIHVKGTMKFVNIHDNIITSNKGRGIMVNNSSGGSIHRNIRIVGNLCVNNGRSGATTDADAGISVAGVDGVIISDNICENDPSLPNPYQAVGIFLRTFDTTPAPGPIKSGIISGNICRNNTTKQIATGVNMDRANNIAVFFNNIQVGNGANNRTWQDQRGIFFGNTPAVAGDGVFRQGDVQFNTAAAPGQVASWVYDGTNWQVAEIVNMIRSGSPEGTASAVPGANCIDTMANELYVKITGTGNTGWRKVAFA